MMSDENPQEKVRERLVSEGQDHAFGAGGGGLGGNSAPSKQGAVGTGGVHGARSFAVCPVLGSV